MIIVPYKIYTSFIQSHSEVNFLYSIDYLMKGGFSQSIVCYGEPNCYPIPTVYKYCANTVYWQDNHYAIDCIDEFMDKIPLDKPIIPFRKIGEGCSRMNELCPKVYEYMKSRIYRIASRDYKINYIRRDEYGV